MNNLETLVNKIGLILIFLLICLAYYCALITGFSWDEYFHHINGLVRYKYLSSLGEFTKYDFRNNEFYPGLYDTISYAFGQIFFHLNKKFYVNNLAELMHFINVTFASLSVLGLYLITKKLFDKNIAIYASLITLTSPFFFGHMGMNSKDLIVFFSLIWFCYYFYRYCVDSQNSFKNLLFLSFFVGFGCGVRLTFLVVIFPVIICGLFYLFNKYRDQYLNLVKRLLLHLPITLLITIFFVILCWPHMIEEIKDGNFVKFFSLIVKNTINWLDGPKLGLINGEFYPVFETPKTYFLSIIFYRLPFYFSILIFFSYIFFSFKNFFIINRINNLNSKFILINVIAFFPILLALFLGANLYDNLRLFLFVIPFLSIIAALALSQILNSFKDSLLSKFGLIIVLVLFSFSFYRFLILTPYQYTYVNYSYLYLLESKGKWEHDYWGVSYKELVKKIKETHSEDEIKNLKIADCGGGDWTLIYYLKKELGIKRTYSNIEDLDQATHIVMNDRAFWDLNENEQGKKYLNEDGSVNIKDLKEIFDVPGLNQKCFTYAGFKGEDVVSVKRGGLPLTIFRKINQ